MQEQMTPVAPRVRAEKKHVILFALACAILTVSIAVFLVSMIGLPSAPTSPDESGADDIGALLGTVILAISNVLTILATLLLCSFGWGAGMIISAHLAFKKQDKPRWLWIGSTVLTAIFTVLVICVLVYFGNILLVLLRFV